MVLSAFFASDAAVTGVNDLYVSHVATDASLRGRGIAGALLGHTLVQAKAKGFQRSSLNVDEDNSTARSASTNVVAMPSTNAGVVM